MEAVVIAVPTEAPPARLGERFTLREGSPLRVGPGRQARLRLGPLGAGDLVIGTHDNTPYLRATVPTLRASLSGRELHGSVDLPLTSGDTLYVHPGLVLEFREGARPPSAHHRELEQRVLDVGDAASFEVYFDFLEEVGDPLVRWLRAAPHADETQRRRQLLGLAESVRGGLAQVTWTERGLLSGLTLTRQAVTGAPGLDWHLEQLRTLPVARLMTRLAVALFAGAAPGRADAGADPDSLAARVLERIMMLDGAPALRSVSLGFVSQPRRWPRAEAAWEQLRTVAPRLEAWHGVVVSGGRAMLSLRARPPDVEAVSADVVLNPSRSDVGTAATCQVRLVGAAPQVSCTLYRSSDGQWVVFDESADPFRPAHGRFALRVNGGITARATLAPGDVVEPVEGLRFVFQFAES